MSLPAGWLTDVEADELRRLSAGRTVLELGAWKGRSTVVLSENAAYVVSVDRHQGIEEVGGDDSLPDYLEAVRGLTNVAIVVADFARVSPLLSDFQMVFVDGDHDERSVARDTLIAVMHLCDGGMVAFHDYDFASVRAGVSMVLGAVEPLGLVGSVASFGVR